MLPLLAALKDADDIGFVLDQRMELPEGMELAGPVYRVKPTLFSRLSFEWRLKSLLSQQVRLLCMGNLPPLFAHQGEQLVFVQNRYLVDELPLDDFLWPVRFRIVMERWWLRSRSGYVSCFIVQTTTMRYLLNRLLKKDAIILPFMSVPEIHPRQKCTQPPYRYDYIYVATGEPHKNHSTLIEAWISLAERGVFPSLCLTLDGEKFPELCDWIKGETKKFSLKVFMVGECSHMEIINLYNVSRALIYPSLLESFGLPLIESAMAGIPVLASNSDYVDDVIYPSASFDPTSPQSIADAVDKFSFQPASLKINLLSARQFLEQTLNLGGV